MNSLIVFTLIIAVSSAAIYEHRITQKLNIPKGSSVKLESLDYPNIPAAGTTNTWYLVGDEGTTIELSCDDVWIAPSKNCENGWFKVVANGKTEKICEMKNDLVAKSENNEMTVQIDLNNTTGRSRCVAKAV